MKRAGLALFLLPVVLVGCDSRDRPKMEVFFGEEKNVYALEGDDAYVCWVIDDGVRCMQRTGSARIRTYAVPRSRIAVRGGKIYAAAKDLVVTDIATGEQKTWAKDVDARWIATDGRDAYVRGAERIERIAEDGTREVVAKIEGRWYEPAGERARRPHIAADAEGVYFIEEGKAPAPGKIHRWTKADKKTTTIYSDPMGAFGLLAAGEWIYFEQPGGLCRVPYRGGKYEKLDVLSGSIWTVDGTRVLASTANEDPPGPGYAHSETGAYVDVCPVAGPRRKCRRFYEDAHGAGIVAAPGGFFTFRQQKRGDPWRLVHAKID